MIPVNKYAVAAVGSQIARHPVGVTKIGYQIAAGAASTLYLQVHDTNAAPAAGAVPLKVWVTTAEDQQDKVFGFTGELRTTKGLYIALSTTEGTFTSGAVGDVIASLQVELYDPDYPLTANVSFAGDLTTGRSTLAIWSEASGLATPQVLLALKITNNSGTAAYAFLFATDASSTGAFPIQSWIVADGETKILQFGRKGESVFSQDADGTKRYGCAIRMSSTTPSYTATGGTSFTIRAEYIAVSALEI